MPEFCVTEGDVQVLLCMLVAQVDYNQQYSSSFFQLFYEDAFSLDENYDLDGEREIICISTFLLLG